jgi:L-rhamnono-1,4-lactonase
MTNPGHFLAKQHGISDYKTVTQSSPAGSSLSGFIYVETDRYLPAKSPNISSNASKEEEKTALDTWAKAPLEELKFLRRIVEDRPEEGDGFAEGEGKLMKGAVVWAPFHLSPSLFQTYLEMAEVAAGEKLWERIVGFRYLLQGKEEGEVKKLVSTDDWIANITSLGSGRGGRGWAFDVGVDIHRDGPDPLGAVGEMIKKVREQEAQSGQEKGPVRFVLSKLSTFLYKGCRTAIEKLTPYPDHLCKHALTAASPTSPTQEWLNALTQLGPDQNIFMKLSGAFNEFDESTPSSSSDIVKSLSSIVLKVFEAFPERVMFGSDWPVCNVGGPAGEKGNWALWVESVEALLNEVKVGDKERESVWNGAGSRAYGVQI